MEEIPSKLKQGWLKLMCVKQSLNSPIWQKFSHIFCRDKKVKHVASYIISKKVYSHTWHKWRSSNLIKHKCKTGQTTITSFISVNVEIKKNRSFFRFEVTCNKVAGKVCVKGYYTFCKCNWRWFHWNGMVSHSCECPAWSSRC